MGKKGITVAGSLIADNFYITDTYPDIGRLTNIRDVMRGVGGSGNLVLDLAKLDPLLPIKVSAVVGEDANGTFVKETLDQYENVDVRNIVQEGDSSMTMVIEPTDSKQRTFFYLPASSDVYDESYIDWEQLDAKIFQLEYLLLMKKVDSFDSQYGTQGARILHEAQKRGMKTSIDIVSEDSDRVKTIVMSSLKYTDYCTINEIEAESITGVTLYQNGRLLEENVSQALEILASMGVSTWAIIHSPSCGYGMNCKTKEIVRVPSLTLPAGYIKGTTGAGDAYCSGVLYGAYQDQTIKEAMELGTACAACSLSGVDGTSGMRSYHEVLKILEQYKEKTI